MNIQVDALSLDLAAMHPLEVVQSHSSAVLTAGQLTALTNGNASLVCIAAALADLNLLKPTNHAITS